VPAPSGPEVGARLIALGASNLTRGLATVVRDSRGLGAPVAVYAALGHGRSYGISSRFCGRTLPGIAGCGLWDALESGPKTKALVTDIGNDVLYDVPVGQILAWVELCVDRLVSLGAEVVVTDLPLASIERLSHAAFLLFRSILVPGCRLSFGVVKERARALNDGVVALAERRRVALVRLRPEWYRGDPIHIRPHFWGPAWREILGTREKTDSQKLNALRLYWARPARQRLLGMEFHRAQPAIRLRGGGSVSLY
jgi:hypothetical protein